MLDLTNKRHLIILNILLAIGYILFAKVGLLMAFAQSSVTAIWPPSGFALTIMLIFGRNRTIWAILFGAFFSNINNFTLNGMDLIDSVLPSILIGISNALETVVCYYLLSRIGKINNPFEEKDGMIKLLFFASLG